MRLYVCHAHAIYCVTLPIWASLAVTQTARTVRVAVAHALALVAFECDDVIRRARVSRNRAAGYRIERTLDRLLRPPFPSV